MRIVWLHSDTLIKEMDNRKRNITEAEYQEVQGQEGLGST